MEQMVKYFLDTYALIEITKGSKNALKYVDCEVYTNILNLYEFYMNLIRDFDEDTAKEKFNNFKQIMIPIKDNHIFLASRFKIANKKRNFSYADALGYVTAKAEDMKFVTGDKEFKNLENVEFI